MISPKLFPSYRLVVLAVASAIFTASVIADAAHDVAMIRKATESFLSALDSDQRATCNLGFDHANREDWKYVPADRLGLAMRDMNDVQLRELDTVLSAILSADGLKKSKGVILCETALYEKSGHDEFRDPSKYHLTVYGTPDESEPWGLRFEGHHISLNYTFVGDHAIAAAPGFFGANPATIMEGPNKGLRILADEEDLGRAFVESLEGDRRTAAVFAETAPKEILTGAKSRVSPLEPKGLAHANMTPAQQKKLMSLIGEYVSWMPEEVAADRLKKIIEGGVENIRFAWAGPIKKGAQHYYRVQGPSFLIEYDNFQGGGKHIHAVWRDFNGDFGRDILKEHYEHGHAH